MGVVVEQHVDDFMRSADLPEAQRRLRVVLVADTIAALKGLSVDSVSSGQLCRVLGYHAAHDGGGGMFAYDSAMTTAENGGTIIAPTTGSGRWRRQEDETDKINVLHWGAKRNVTEDNGPAIQAAFDFAASIATGREIVFPSGKYYMATGVDLSTHKPNQRITAYGAEIWTDVASIEMFTSLDYPNNSAINRPLHWAGGLIVGDQQAGQVGMDFGKTYAATFQDIEFKTLGYGLVITFGLMAEVRNCLFSSCSVRPLVIRSAYISRDGVSNSGVWPGVTLFNANSHISRIDTCRVYGELGAPASYSIFASDACFMSRCISEGFADGTDIEWDSFGATTINTFKVVDFWCEAPPSTLFLRVKNARGDFYLEGIRQSYGRPFIDPSGRAGTFVCIVDKCRTWPAIVPTDDNPNGYRFYHTNGGGLGGTPGGGDQQQDMFIFRDCLGSLATDPNNWENNVAPIKSYDWQNGQDNRSFNIVANGSILIRPRVNASSDTNKIFVLDGNFLMEQDNKWDFGRANNRPRTLFCSSGGVNFQSNQSLLDMRHASAALNFPSIASGATAELTITVTGVTESGIWDVNVSPRNGMEAGLIWSGYVSAADTVTVRVANVTGSAIDPASRTFKVTAFRR